MKQSYLVALALVLVAFFGSDRASAQPAGSRVEVGAHAALLRLDGFNGGTSTTNGGVGGRVSFDLTNWMALEGEVNFFPRDKIAGPDSGDLRQAQYWRRTDALAGLRIGARRERMGVFLKARPGITYLAFNHGSCEGPGCSLILPAPVRDRYKTEFAFDVGGGVEFYATGRAIARAEIGDTIIRHGNESTPWGTSTSRTSHNVSSRFGVGFRF